MSESFMLLHSGIYNKDEEEREGRVERAGRRVEGAEAFIFSASHVIFIVNKTHLALLSEQGLAGKASFHRETRRAGG